MPQPQIPYYHLLNQWLLGATNGNQGQRMMHTPPHTSMYCTLCMHPHTHIAHAPPCMHHCTCTLHTRIVCTPTCALHIHPPCVHYTCPPTHALCMHPPCTHCVCCPHVRIARTPPTHALPVFDWLSVPTTANQITSF